MITHATNRLGYIVIVIVLDITSLMATLSYWKSVYNKKDTSYTIGTWEISCSSNSLPVATTDHALTVTNKDSIFWKKRHFSFIFNTDSVSVRA